MGERFLVVSAACPRWHSCGADLAAVRADRKTLKRDAAIANRHGRTRRPGPGDNRHPMKLDPISLRLFVAVMEESAIARAAAREHIAPSAASRRLAELESQLQVELFTRSNRGSVPRPPPMRC
jgi:hypothetical protein